VGLSGSIDGITTRQYRLISATNWAAAAHASFECKCLPIDYSLLACRADSYRLSGTLHMHHLSYWPISGCD